MLGRDFKKSSNGLLGCFKSAKNFICQKVQHFQADSESLGKINNKKIFKNFFCQCLPLPKDRQSFCEVQKKCHQIFSKKIFLFHMNYPNVPKMQKFSKNSNWKWV